jgi:hypothetical protein
MSKSSSKVVKIVKKLSTKSGEEELEGEEEDWYSLDQVPTSSHLVKMPQSFQTIVKKLSKNVKNLSNFVKKLSKICQKPIKMLLKL